MQWEVLIIPLIALGVWILGTVFGKNEQPPARRPGRMPGERRQPSSQNPHDIEESRRRREAGGQRRPKPIPETVPASRPEPARATPIQDRGPAKPRTTERAQPQARQAPRQPDRPVVPGALSPKQMPDAIPVAEIVTLAQASKETYHERAKLSVSAVAGGAVKPASPAIAHVMSLLRSPGSAGAAFVLREILDPPLSRRERKKYGRGSV